MAKLKVTSTTHNTGHTVVPAYPAVTTVPEMMLRTSDWPRPQLIPVPKGALGLPEGMVQATPTTLPHMPLAPPNLVKAAPKKSLLKGRT